MKVAVILDNGSGVLDRSEIEIPDGADESAVSEAIEDAIAPWVLSVGDTIRIVEVPA